MFVEGTRPRPPVLQLSRQQAEAGLGLGRIPTVSWMVKLIWASGLVIFNKIKMGEPSEAPNAARKHFELHNSGLCIEDFKCVVRPNRAKYGLASEGWKYLAKWSVQSYPEKKLRNKTNFKY